MHSERMAMTYPVKSASRVSLCLEYDGCVLKVLWGMNTHGCCVKAYCSALTMGNDGAIACTGCTYNIVGVRCAS